MPGIWPVRLRVTRADLDGALVATHPLALDEVQSTTPARAWARKYAPGKRRPQALMRSR